MGFETMLTSNKCIICGKEGADKSVVVRPIQGMGGVPPHYVPVHQACLDGTLSGWHWYGCAHMNADTKEKAEVNGEI